MSREEYELFREWQEFKRRSCVVTIKDSKEEAKIVEEPESPIVIENAMTGSLHLKPLEEKWSSYVVSRR